ncbi:septum formation family protein [Luedemannella helvata]|uniref:septum formation family protein n=1 Tax=Luedemannella helvata TaxID=349315 RepID=UPI0031E106B6
MVALLAAAAALALGGCAAVAGDGDLTGDWAILPKAQVPVPASGVCRANIMSEKSIDWDLALFVAPPVDCKTRHATETYYVGKITDAKAVKSTSPPEYGDAAFKTVYTNCAKQATKFLGDDYHDARVFIAPVLPTDLEWRGEARFYRCEMIELAADGEGIAERAASLKDGLRGKRPAAVQCVNYSDEGDHVEDLRFVPCAKPHLAEYTGTYMPKDGKFPGEDKASDRGAAGCLAVSARYVGMTVAALDAVGGYQWIHDGTSEGLWSIGERGERCYMGSYPGKKRTGSIKGKSPSRW